VAVDAHPGVASHGSDELRARIAGAFASDLRLACQLRAGVPGALRMDLLVFMSEVGARVVGALTRNLLGDIWLPARVVRALAGIVVHFAHSDSFVIVCVNAALCDRVLVSQ